MLFNIIALAHEASQGGPAAPSATAAAENRQCNLLLLSLLRQWLGEAPLAARFPSFLPRLLQCLPACHSLAEKRALFGVCEAYAASKGRLSPKDIRAFAPLLEANSRPAHALLLLHFLRTQVQANRVAFKSLLSAASTSILDILLQHFIKAPSQLYDALGNAEMQLAQSILTQSDAAASAATTQTPLNLFEISQALIRQSLNLLSLIFEKLGVDCSQWALESKK